jgi:hypothetical protein
MYEMNPERGQWFCLVVYRLELLIATARQSNSALGIPNSKNQESLWVLLVLSKGSFSSSEPQGVVLDCFPTVHLQRTAPWPQVCPPEATRQQLAPSEEEMVSWVAPVNPSCCPHTQVTAHTQQNQKGGIGSNSWAQLGARFSWGPCHSGQSGSHWQKKGWVDSEEGTHTMHAGWWVMTWTIKFT